MRKLSYVFYLVLSTLIISCSTDTNIGNGNMLIVEKIEQTSINKCKYYVVSRKIERTFFNSVGEHEGFFFSFYAPKDKFNINDTLDFIVYCR